MSKVAAGLQKVDPLREQLDELDLLMERMLSLGVTRSGKESAAPQAEPQPELTRPKPIAKSLEPESEPEPVPEPEQGIQIGAPVPELSAPALESPAIFESAPILALNEGTAEEAASEQPPVPEILDPAPSLEPILDQQIDLAMPGPSFVAVELSPAAPSAPFYADFQFAPPPSELALEAIEAPAPVLAPVRTVAESADPLVFVAWWLQPFASVNSIYDGSTRWLGPIGRGLRSRPVKNILGLCGLAALIGAVAWMAWENADWNS